MSYSKQNGENDSSRIKHNEERIDALHAERTRLEEEEYETEQYNRRLLRVTYESESWKGPAATQFNSQQEVELLDAIVSGRKEFARRYKEISDSVASLHKENESLREKLKREKEEK